MLGIGNHIYIERVLPGNRRHVDTTRPVPKQRVLGWETLEPAVSVPSMELVWMPYEYL